MKADFDIVHILKGLNEFFIISKTTWLAGSNAAVWDARKRKQISQSLNDNIYGRHGTKKSLLSITKDMIYGLFNKKKSATEKRTDLIRTTAAHLWSRWRRTKISTTSESSAKKTYWKTTEWPRYTTYDSMGRWRYHHLRLDRLFSFSLDIWQRVRGRRRRKIRRRMLRILWGKVIILVAKERFSLWLTNSVITTIQLSKTNDIQILFSNKKIIISAKQCEFPHSWSIFRTFCY